MTQPSLQRRASSNLSQRSGQLQTAVQACLTVGGWARGSLSSLPQNAARIVSPGSSLGPSHST